MKKIIFRGSGVAIVTPFTKKGVDFDKLGELIEFQIKEGTDAIIICGTTGEASTMHDPEHKKVISYAVKKVAKRVPVIAGTGSNYTDHAIDLSQHAEEAGADAILSVTPYYNKTSQAGLFEHFRVISESTSLPIILYNVPSRTGMNLEPSTMEKLAKISNINAVKECNLLQVPEVVNICGNDLNIYSGEDGQVSFYLATGALGVISVMANIIPKYTHEMVMKYFNDDQAGSWKMQLGCLNLVKALFCEVNPMPVKTACNLMGMNIGSCRLPLVDISPANLELLKKELVAFGLL